MTLNQDTPDRPADALTGAIDPFTPYPFAGRTLRNRIVMSPMTRSRSPEPARTATPSMALYYAQRASAGLIVTEGTSPSEEGHGYTNTPGIHSGEQVESWKQVTAAVHDEGGVVFAQLMHAGRIGHPDIRPDGLPPIGPSAVTPVGQTFTHDGMQDYVEPRAYSEAGIERTIADFASAARNAVEAGFDGVELHGASGYLIHQFLSPHTNRRSDRWGGSVENRIRFAVEVATAVSAEIGAERVGFRISPGIALNDINEGTDLAATYLPLVSRLAELDLAHLHEMESAGRMLTNEIRAAWPNTFILNPDTHPRPTGPDELILIEDGTTDLMSFGVNFIANPDLPERLQNGTPLADPDGATMYGGGDVGYIDYPRA
ncbi:alkene reductase [Curtobacterium sp. MCPF17_011]|uniref:alkene reductase n=1 Tax=Curtobacterium sp. MCPF17_011 TaxID=2175652 RepID=UPI000DA98F54|nr:alkene reductase [Curtobacterium sp. MCPF17_011]PZF11919.1 alkene reductase [Curtobacterium sp. MCPF17_011]